VKRPENPTEQKLELQRRLANGELTIGQAALKMRKIVGMTQEEYASTILGIAPRVLMEVERDRGNIWQGLMAWVPGMILAEGTVAGAKVGVRIAITPSHKGFKWFLFVMTVMASAATLLNK
jgi:hypothetical protein